MPESKRIESPRFEYRAGKAFPRWGGHILNGDPASNPINRPRMLINTRFDGGGLKARRGLTQYGGGVFSSATHHIRHITEHRMTSGKRLWIITNGCPGISPTAGYSLSNIDHEQMPIVQRALYFNTATADIKVASFGGVPYISNDDALRKIQMISLPYGSEAITLSGYSQDQPIATMQYDITAMLEFDDKLFIGEDNGVGASIIEVYDGVSIVPNELTGINAPTCFAKYRVDEGGDAIVVGFGSAANQIQYRPTGDSPGTWTPVAPGAGTVSAVDMLSYQDVLYIASGTTTVWQFDGSTLSVARTIAGAEIMALAEVDDVLYFLYKETGGDICIGSNDGGVWTDLEKNLTTQFSGTTQGYSMKEYRNALYVAGVKDSAGIILKSPEIPQGSVSGAWDEEIELYAANVGSCIGLVVI